MLRKAILAAALAAGIGTFGGAPSASAHCTVNAGGCYGGHCYVNVGTCYGSCYINGPLAYCGDNASCYLNLATWTAPTEALGIDDLLCSLSPGCES